MDDIDSKIIKELQQDGRLSNQALSERVGLSPSPCLKRLKALENTGYIKGYTALIDEKLYGLPVTVFLRVKLGNHAEDAIKNFEKQILLIDEVQDCFLITGDADYLLRVIVRDLDHYENLIRQRLQRIPAISAIDSSVAFGKVKQSFVFPAIS